MKLFKKKKTSEICNKPSFVYTGTQQHKKLSLLHHLSLSLVHQSLSYFESKACLENIYFDLFYGSLDALQLWAVMCLIDNERRGKQRERERGMERVIQKERVSMWVMPLFDNDDPLVQKSVSQSQWWENAFDTLRTFFGSCLLQLSSCCLWL